MPRNTLYYVAILVLLSRARGEYEDEIQSVFKNNTTRNDFTNLLQSLIKLNEQRVNILQKLYKLEDYGVLSEVLRSGSSHMENEKLRNLFLVVLSKNQSTPSKNVRRSMNKKKPDSLLNPDKKSKEPNEFPVHQEKRKHPSEPTTENLKEINRIRDNFELVFGNVEYPKPEKKRFQDRFHVEDGRPRPPAPGDKFGDHDRTTKYSKFSKSQHHFKYTGKEGAHENRGRSEHPPHYPHVHPQNKENSKAEDERNVNRSVQERYGMEAEEPKRAGPSHERFQESHSYKNIDIGHTEEVHEQEQSHENPTINIDAYDYDSGPKLNVDIYGKGKTPSKSDSDTPDDKNSFPHVNLKEYPGLPIESRKNLQKCLGKKATKMCSKSCISAYKNVCRWLKCSSRSKRALKKECKKSCKTAFATSKYSDDE